jgi:hypothetical protein
VAGTNAYALASLYHVTDQSIYRHRDAGHVSGVLLKAQAVSEIANADRLLSEANTLYTTSTAIMRAAYEEGDRETALKAINTAGRMLTLLGELLGELNRQPQVNIFLSPQWATLRTVLFNSLAPFPEARAALAAGLQTLELDAELVA